MVSQLFPSSTKFLHRILGVAKTPSTRGGAPARQRSPFGERVFGVAQRILSFYPHLHMLQGCLVLTDSRLTATVTY